MTTRPSAPPERDPARDGGVGPGLRAALARLAAQTGRDPGVLEGEARRHLHELRTTHDPRVHGLWVRAGRALLARGYAGVDHDPAQLERVRELLGNSPCAVLASHRSYLDGGALTVGFHDHGLPPLTVFGGINMAFWPLGALWRRNGMVFIRRGGDDAVYRLSLRHRLAELVRERRPLQWFLEGTRSRTGKLGPPRLGLLAWLADAIAEGTVEDLQLLPVAIAYDRLHEVTEYAGEARGAAKTAESLGWLLRFVRAQHGHHGYVYVRFGTPLSLRSALQAAQGTASDDPVQRRRALQKVAFEVAARINSAMPLTGSALATLALLGARGRALTVPQVRAAVQGYLDFAAARALPLAPTALLRTDAAVMGSLEGLVAQGVATRHDAGRERVYGIAPGQHLAAAYYRNGVAHHFLAGAVAELALLAAATHPPGRRAAALEPETLALRDVLKFDFFPAGRAGFAAEVRAEADRLAPGWPMALEQGTAGVLQLLERMPTLASDMLLRAFVEAYRVVVDALDAPAHAAGEEGPLLAACMGLGEQYGLQGRLHAPESVSRHLYLAGLELARHRQAVGAEAEAAQRRHALAAELDAILHGLDAVHRVAVRRVEAGLREARASDGADRG